MTPETFKSCREHLGLSTRQMASVLAVSQSKVARMESGQRRIDIETAAYVGALIGGYRPDDYPVEAERPTEKLFVVHYADPESAAAGALPFRARGANEARYKFMQHQILTKFLRQAEITGVVEIAG
ncbi:MAG: helix-turn-helix domain-containing protein [Octadecabacter sp.]|nr:helix-turn-helix domain-containing protein [Octadecabacter sp.]